MVKEYKLHHFPLPTTHSRLGLQLISEVFFAINGQVSDFQALPEDPEMAQELLRKMIKTSFATLAALLECCWDRVRRECAECSETKPAKGSFQCSPPLENRSPLFLGIASSICALCIETGCSKKGRREGTETFGNYRRATKHRIFFQN